MPPIRWKKPSDDPQAPQADPPAAITFASFRMDLRAGRLLCGDEDIPLRPKTWSVLHYLAERPGVLVTKTDLMDAVWPDLAVTESVLSQSIGELRGALGDRSKPWRIIETVPRRGFRFTVPVSPDVSPELEDTDLRTQHSGLRTPFVGRTKELQQLAACFAKAHAGERQVVFITGPPGIGKTALVEVFLSSPALREARAPVWIARGLCVEQHGPSEAYLPVLEALERVARRPDAEPLVRLLRRIAPTWLAQMHWLVGDDEEEQLRQSLQVVRPERMQRELATLVEALTTNVTLALVLEDLHWSDPSTIDLLAALAERHESARLLVIGTYRPADAIARQHILINSVRALDVRRRCVELPLSDLTEEGVRSYLQARFPGSDFHAGFAGMIHRHTDGNPLFMTAVVDHLLSRGDILDTAPGWALSVSPETLDLGVPDNVRLLIKSQVDGLSPTDRALLEAASVAGSDFTTLVLAAALGREVADAEMRCEGFVNAQRFLRVTGRVDWPDGSVSRRYAFSHELYRQVVYTELPEERCMRLHQRIGQALEAAYGARPTDIAAQLALHFERGRDGVRALHYLTAAATGARARFASRETIGYLKAALALVALQPEDDERRRRELELRLSLGTGLGDIHGFASEQVRGNYERAAELCAAVGSAAQLLAILHARVSLHTFRSERAEVIALVAEIDALARRTRAAEHRLLAESVMLRIAFYEGRFTDMSRHMRRLLAAQRRRGAAGAPLGFGDDPLISAISHFGSGLWFLGDPERAQSTAREALALARKSGHFLTLTAALMHAAFVELLCRNTMAGADLAEQAVSVSAEHGFAAFDGLASVLRGWASVQQDRAVEGSAAIDRALTAMQATGTRFFSAHAYAFLAEARLRTGTLADGLVAADAGLAVARTSLDRAYEPELWRIKGELLLQQSKVESRKLALSKVEGSKARRARSGHAGPDTAGQAEACFQRALELARATQAKSLELRAATSLAGAWQARGRTAEARKLLSGVCKWFGARAGTADLVEARALLGELAKAR